MGLCHLGIERDSTMEMRQSLLGPFQPIQEVSQMQMRIPEGVIRSDDTFGDAHLHLGYLLYRLKRTEEALPHFHRAIALNPKMAEAHLMLGLTLLQANRFDDAITAFRNG